jgi:hypothetical protein
MLHQVGMDTSVYRNAGQIWDHQVSMMDKPIGHLWVSITFKLASLILGKNFMTCSSIHMNCTTDHECCQETTWTHYDSIRQRNSKGLYYTYWLRSLPFTPYVIVLRTHDFYVYRRKSLPGGMIHTRWKFTRTKQLRQWFCPPPPPKRNSGPQQEPGNIPRLTKMCPRRKHKR